MLHIYIVETLYFCVSIKLHNFMEQIHAHEVLHMMEGTSYTESSLKESIIEKFGKDQHFYTCSAENMNIDELIVFLKNKGKFMPTENDNFTVDITKVCNH